MKAALTALRHRVGSWRLARFLRLQLRYSAHIRPNLARQLAPTGAPAPAGERRPRILVPLIETAHYQFYQILALAKALQLRGADIKVLLCGSRLNGCEIKSTRTADSDPCLECRFNHRRIVQVFGLDTVELTDFVTDAQVGALRASAERISRNYPERFDYKGVNIMPMTNDSVTRYFYGSTPEDPDMLRDVRARHLETSMIGLDAAQAIFESWKPDSVLGNMNVYSAWEPYARFFANHGIKMNVVSMSTFNHGAIAFNRMDLYIDNRRFEKWLASRGGAKLHADEKKELAGFMADRFEGTASIFKDTDMFGAARSAIESLRIDESKRNVFLFSNIFWDVGLTETASIFDGVVPWVLETIEMLKDHPDCHLYIKPHPAEVYDSTTSLKGIADCIRERFPVLPGNVTIIPPELKIKTYDLFPMIDVGILYNGTIGLEMLQRNIPVVVAGLAPYGHLKSVSSPKSREEYKGFLTGEVEAARPDLDEVEMFSYFYFIKTLLPWTLTKKVYGDDFKGFAFQSLDDIMPGKDPALDHLCRCILDPRHTVVEGWRAAR